MSPPSSGSKNEPNKSLFCYLLHVDFLLGLFLDPEEGDEISQKTELWIDVWYARCLCFSIIKHHTVSWVIITFCHENKLILYISEMS
jgi:hypothetical protein